MDWLDVSEELPAPRDDEPAGLRQDIVDELGDHLRCALVREALHTADENAARESVLKKFGDPRRVARRLWLDAMQERIMLQRITLALAGLVTIACFVAVGLVWKIAEDNRAANLALVSKLDEVLAERGTTPEDLNWNETRVRVVQGEPGGKPVENCTVMLNAVSEGAFRGLVVERATDANGLADFGLLQVGSYYISVTTPWGDSTSSNTYILPETETLEFVGPPTSAEGELTVNVEWPDDLREKNLYVYASLRLLREVEGHTWWRHPGPFIVSDTGQVCEVQWRPNIGGSPDSSTLRVVLCDLPLHVPEGEYRMFEFRLLELTEPPQPEMLIRWGDPPTLEDVALSPPLVVSAAGDNTLTLKIPDSVIEAIRTKLRDAES